MEKKIVACIIPSLSTGGAEKMALDLVTYLDKKTVDVILISLYPSEKGIYDNMALERNLKVIYLNKKNGIDFNLFFELFLVLKKLRPNIIHTHLLAILYLLPWIILHKEVKWVHTIHNEASKELPKLHSRIMSLMYRKKRAIPVAISEVIQKTISSFYSLDKRFIPIIHNGVDTHLFTPPSTPPSKEFITFCCVARFSPQKNHILLIEAFNLAYLQCPNISLILVGDGELRMQIENRIDYYKLGERVTIVGKTNDVLSWLRISDAFVLASDYEGLPLSVLEAMSVGLPIVATSVGGLPDIIKDGENGILTPKGNMNLLADSLIKIVQDEQLRRKFAIRNQECSTNFDVRKMAELYNCLYKQDDNKQMG
jgi:glycosyltransferase involved in cell wall biosynthesis